MSGKVCQSFLEDYLHYSKTVFNPKCQTKGVRGVKYIFSNFSCTMSDYVWILFFINFMMMFFFSLFFWWRVRAGHRAVQGEEEAGPPPYNTLQYCENPPAYDSIFVHKPPSIV